ncbi:uncharacterized protein LOC122638898 [Telopea speciosissima]|uniref:uncharacterized protein LOC122638898 n=1 Tax=Telopea speciosissima TaxID=54955 RepID=UPI001CC51D61|nr:uncharacterized protein LOC122638898 [Telopea speciosissima]
MSLVQGSKSVQEYQQKYEELHHFVPPYLRDEQGKASRFERGLRNTVGTIVLSHNLQRYTKVVQMAKSIEDQQNETSHPQSNTGKRTASSQNTQGPSKYPQSYYVNPAPFQYVKPEVPQPTRTIQSAKSSQPANVPIWCFTCRQYGHISKYCQQKKPEVSAIIFTAASTPFSGPCYSALPRASHSFVSPTFTKKMHITAKDLTQGLAVSTPTGSVVQLDVVYEPCTVEVCGRKMTASLIELDMTDFDVILGMGWLAEYQANVVCAKKQIV